LNDLPRVFIARLLEGETRNVNLKEMSRSPGTAMYRIFEAPSQRNFFDVIITNNSMFIADFSVSLYRTLGVPVIECPITVCGLPSTPEMDRPEGGDNSLTS
jgi:hypothetical protein